jgi:hypothetical protein
MLAQSPLLPPDKQAIEQQYSQERAAGAHTAAPKNPQAPYPIAPEQPFLKGIMADCSAPFSSQEINIANCWQGTLSGVNTVVYAGAEADALDPQQSVVYVLALPGYPVPVSGNSVLAPVKGGSLGIVAEQNGVLTLVSSTGRYVMTFDVRTRTFSSVAVDATAPTITGMPARGCTLWPPDHKLVQVGVVTAQDTLSGLALGSFKVTGTSNEPSSDPKNPEVMITPNASGGFVIQLQADRLGSGSGRVYSLTASVADNAGNMAQVSATCTVPHDQGKK